jgi:hypothetical protein
MGTDVAPDEWSMAAAMGEQDSSNFILLLTTYIYIQWHKFISIMDSFGRLYFRWLMAGHVPSQ